MSLQVSAFDGMGSAVNAGGTITSTGMDASDIMQITNDILSGQGVYNVSGDSFLVEQNGTPNMSVNVRKGICYVENDSYSFASNVSASAIKYWRVTNDATVNVSIDNTVSNPRRDRICVKIDPAAIADDEASNVATVVVVKGTEAASPSLPAEPSNHLTIATILIPNPSSTITTSAITDTRTEIEFDTDAIPDITTSMISNTAVTKDKIDFSSGIWWEELGRATPPTEVDVMTVTISSRKYLKILVNVLVTATNTAQLVFNNDGGNNYAYRTETDNVTGTVITTTNLALLAGVDSNSPAFAEVLVENTSLDHKLVMWDSMRRNITASALAAPNRMVKGIGVWANSATQITTVMITNTSAGGFISRSEVVVLGHN